MKIINSKGQLFGKVSIIDIGVIAIILVGIVLLLKFFNVEGPEIIAETDELIFTFETGSGVTKDYVDQIVTGIPVYNSENNTYLGELVNYSVEPYRIEYENHDKGIFELVEQPDEVTVKIQVKSKVQITNDNILVTSEEIKIGRKIALKGKGFASYGYIINIEEVD